MGVPRRARRFFMTVGVAGLAGRPGAGGVHGQPAAGAAEHRHAAQLSAAAAAAHPDHHGHRLDRRRVQPASAVRSVAGERGDQRAGAAQRVPAGARPRHADGLALGDGPDPAGVRRGDQPEPVHGDLQDPARGAVDRQRPDRRRRLLVPVAADGQPARGRRSGRIRPDHRRAVARGRQAGRRHLRAAVSGVEGTVQQHPSGAHRQGRAGRFRGRAGPGAAGHRRAVPGGEHRPAARRDPDRPQRPLLGTSPPNPR